MPEGIIKTMHNYDTPAERFEMRRGHANNLSIGQQGVIMSMNLLLSLILLVKINLKKADAKGLD